MSHVTADKLVDYYRKAIDYGAAAIVLPSINPSRTDNLKKNNVINEALVFNTGLKPKKDYMGFSVQGPLYPNLISPCFGIRLSKALRACIEEAIPIIGSIANEGERADVIRAAIELSRCGISGLELNFSCPNLESENKSSIDYIVETVCEIRNYTEIPISIKLTPDSISSEIWNKLADTIDSITLTNAYTGLMPPLHTSKDISPFRTSSKWAPSGVYGPFERLLTYNNLFTMSKTRESNCDLACVGGLIAPEHAVEAILLGASIVQLSSAVAWSGLSCFKEFESALVNYCDRNSVQSINEIRGGALQYIENAVCDLTLKQSRVFEVNPDKCKCCADCVCIERLCVAIARTPSRAIEIDKRFCSGCGWCYQRCPHGAIEECRLAQ